jgi:tetratricopeptide (TPR) repeat protein
MILFCMTENASDVSVEFHDLDSLWNSVNAARSEAAFQALLPVASRFEGRDRCNLIELLAQIARAQTTQKKISEARVSLDEAEKLLKDLQAVCPVSVKIRWLIEKGRLFILERTPSQALVVFENAYMLAKDSGEDHFVVEIAQMMAMIDSQKSQLDWIMRGIRIAEDSSQLKARQWLGTLYASLGWKLYDLHKYEKSLEIFQKSLTYLKASGTEREVFVARWSIGKVLRTMKKTEEALEIQKGIIADLGIGGIRDGRFYEELAECLHSLERAEEAQLYFELAYHELSNDEWTANNQPGKLKRMKELGKVKEKR